MLLWWLWIKNICTGETVLHTVPACVHNSLQYSLTAQYSTIMPLTLKQLLLWLRLCLVAKHHFRAACILLFKSKPNPRLNVYLLFTSSPAHSALPGNGKQTWLVVCEEGPKPEARFELWVRTPSMMIQCGGRREGIRGGEGEVEGCWKNCLWNGAITAAYIRS